FCFLGDFRRLLGWFPGQKAVGSRIWHNGTGLTLVCRNASHTNASHEASETTGSARSVSRVMLLKGGVDTPCTERSLIKERGVSLHQGRTSRQPLYNVSTSGHTPHGDNACIIRKMLGK